MRIAQIALVTAVVIVGLLGYTKPGHRILNAIGLPNACKHGCEFLGVRPDKTGPFR
jgi:hypothetical protein